MTRASLVHGEDGLARCAWSAADAEYRRYHDGEWGRPLHGDRPLFEKLCLEGFQAGLSWITILRKRPRFREVFHGFDVDAVAAMDEDDVERLMGDAGIIRNRAKILAAVGNARAVRALVDERGEGTLDRMIWAHAADPRGRPRPTTADEIPAVTVESTALSRELKAHGLRFVGPTTVYALMQSSGLVDDHVVGCHRAA
ncbi:DNA-3-methyladenine glycosylase I [Clavibacter michiganensis]|uniref:DNA-3-methyladenine glycosylase I n=1 Tax=Clavibacter michiganensis TaxID=28447 RepID=UPI000B9F021C|nr:DNA-3-methyladenine glycosylase I [Clavibacter michiganensis]AWG00948.1 3-methyladenine DNA glycosylase [Clavibacter michiganensis subsp. insidiosus]OQJ60471.1 3-methyladenine DNA glycosylase [Clavibacter michiganensis subsp. insidiosus]